MRRRRSAGFSLFEMVVSICVIAILYMIAEQRLNDLPAAAERANFHAVLEQIKAGVKLEMIDKVSQGRVHELMRLEGANPMGFLVETPSNYGGELDLVTDAVRRRNAWYFERSTGQLVYVVGGSSINDVYVRVAGIPVNLGQIRLRLTNTYSGSGNWDALVLAPVYEYTWDARAEQALSMD